jgi:hypothetical protein
MGISITLINMRHTFGKEKIALKKVFIILFVSFLVGMGSALFSKGSKEAYIAEECAEKVIEHETGMPIDFDELDEALEAEARMIEFKYPTFQMDFKTVEQPFSMR